MGLKVFKLVNTYKDHLLTGRKFGNVRSDRRVMTSSRFLDFGFRAPESP